MKKGSILIEDCISLFLFLIFITTSLFIFRSLLKTINKRKVLSDINRSIYALESEIRYNESFNEIEERLKKDFCIKYNNEFLKNMEGKDIFHMDNNYKNNEYLKLKIKEKGKTYMKIKVIIKFQNNYIEKEFYKGIWMDEVQ